MIITGPLDETHSAALLAVERIRRYVATLRADVAGWEPRPMPKGWGKR
jgi:hypothetical protein